MKHLLKIGCLVVFMLIFVSSAFAGREILQTPALHHSGDGDVACVIRNVHEDESISVYTSIFQYNVPVGGGVDDNLEAGTSTGPSISSASEGLYHCDFEVTRDMDRHIFTTICTSFGCVSGFNIK
jgi:hypothetical protein